MFTSAHKLAHKKAIVCTSKGLQAYNNTSLNKHIATILNVAEIHSIIRKSDPEWSIEACLAALRSYSDVEFKAILWLNSIFKQIHPVCYCIV